jgi:hypothetical protein
MQFHLYCRVTTKYFVKGQAEMGHQLFFPQFTRSFIEILSDLGGTSISNSLPKPISAFVKNGGTL